MELLIGAGVFAFLALASIAVLNICTGGWRMVESKTDVTRQVNMFEADVIQELKRASLSSVGIYTPGSDFRWALWMKTPMNSRGSVDADGNPLRLGEPEMQITNQGEAVMQRYVVYYVTRMDAALHVDRYGFLCASYATSAGPDTICPHKWIVKKDLYLRANRTSGDDSIGKQGDPAAVARLATITHDGSCSENSLAAQAGVGNVSRVRILARNIVSFEITRLALNPSAPMVAPTVHADGPIVLFDVKAFKLLSAGDKIRVGSTSAVSVDTVADAGVPGGQMVKVQSATSATGDVTIHASSSVLGDYSPFAIQVDNRVIPRNP